MKRLKARAEARRAAVGVVVVLIAVAAAQSAGAQVPPVPVGYDVSFPQCGSAFPSGAAFAIVGVNAGLPFSPNPCLGPGDGPSELQWAGAVAQLYANTADPGPARSSHWPNGQTSPQQCNTAASPGADTLSCTYDYGWNAAQDSYQDAVNAYVALGLLPAGATRTPAANVWWLDVESANSWEANTANNVAELQGEVDALKSLGVTAIGFYAPPENWQAITGGGSAFASYPFWLPGATSLTDAEARCSQTGPNGGAITQVQFPATSGGADVACAQVPVLAFATPAQTVPAGRAAGPLVLKLPPAPGAVTVTVSSDSATGRFAAGPTVPGSATLSITVPAGAGQTAPFYYRDTRTGMPLLRAHADGYADATQTETITAVPVCAPPTVHDHGYELALAHAATAAVAHGLLRAVAPQSRAHHLRPLIERDSCTDYEVAIGGFTSRASAVAALRTARRTFHTATLERT